MSFEESPLNAETDAQIRGRIEHHAMQIELLLNDLHLVDPDEMYGNIEHITDQLRKVRVLQRKLEQGEEHDRVSKLRNAGL